MKKLHANRLRKLADHLKRGKLGHKRFDIRHYNSGLKVDGGCGTSGCALGECPLVFPKSWHFSGIGFCEVTLRANLETDAHASAVTFFGLSCEEAFHLFWSGSQRPGKFGGEQLEDDATPEQVASNIYAFLKVKGF